MLAFAALLSVLSVFAFAPTVAGLAVAVPAQTTEAPQGAYAVGVRTLALDRGSARPLPTTVWYPATGTGGQGAAVASGRFPLVVFSHGLQSRPEDHKALTTRWAAAGFVVIAPAYPHTRKGAPRFSRADIVNQPADAWAVVRAVSRLDRRTGDRFAGHLQTDRVVAAGHSAGAYTSAALFVRSHSDRLRGAIVIAGARPKIAFAGPPAPILFVHGSADKVVPYSTGRATYARVPWPKAFVTIPRGDHGSYLNPARPGFDQVLETTTAFLRWTLYADDAALCKEGPLVNAFGRGRAPC